MKKLLVALTAFLLLPGVLFTSPHDRDDDYIITESNRRVLVRLEFLPDETHRPDDASLAALAELAPLFSDGVMRRYEIYGNFCAGVEGSRMNAVMRTESVFNSLVRRGVLERSITSTMNVTEQGRGGVCNDERRVDVVSIDIHRERRRRPAPPLPIAAEGRRTVAVYMAGVEPQTVRGVHNILGGELVRVISANENFLAVDRTDFILEQLELEHEYQRSGMVDDEQIQALGRQLGVELMCISNIVAVGNGYYIDTRLVDIVTAENVRTVTATSTLRNAAEMMRVARDVAHELVDPGRANRCGHGAETVYDPAHQFCFGGRAYNLCGGSGYNPQTQGCIANREVGTLCADGTVVTLGTHCGQHTLSIAVAPPTGGTITRTPDAQTYRADETVTLSATANRGFTFAGWAGAQTSSENFISVTMTRNMPVIAMFKPENNNALITTSFPADGGRITRAPESNEYQSGETVRVTATPNRGYEFVRWEGAASSTNATINVMMNEGKALVAIFRPNLHTLNAVAVPEIGGQVFINGTALAEASSSDFGNIVEAFARPAQGYVFTGWSGGATGRANPVIIDLTNANVNVIANFAPQVANNETRIIAVSSQVAPQSTTRASVQPQQRSTQTRQNIVSQEPQPSVAVVSPSSVTHGTFRDTRDGRTYRTVTIGNQTWMAQNLNYRNPSWSKNDVTGRGRAGRVRRGDKGSWCYDNDIDNCNIYGRLYTWSAAMEACPAGWRLPSDDEWTALTNAVGAEQTAGTKLKSSAGWRSSWSGIPVGTDDYGFSALPGGHRMDFRWDRRYDKFSNVGNVGYWWTATENDADADDARFRLMSSNGEYVRLSWSDKRLGFSVRCVMD